MRLQHFLMVLLTGTVFAGFASKSHSAEITSTKDPLGRLVLHVAGYPNSTDIVVSEIPMDRQAGILITVTDDATGDSISGKYPRTSVLWIEIDTFGGRDYISIDTRIATDIETRGGDDVIFCSDADDNIYSGGGDDTIFTQGGWDRVYSGSGNDRVECQSEDLNYITAFDFKRVYLGPGADDFRGSYAQEYVRGGSGSDDIWGLEGQDELHGDGGIDCIHGGPGDDFIAGGTERDFIWGDEGGDEVVFDGTDALVDYGYFFAPALAAIARKVVTGEYAGYSTLTY